MHDTAGRYTDLGLACKALLLFASAGALSEAYAAAPASGLMPNTGISGQEMRFDSRPENPASQGNEVLRSTTRALNRQQDGEKIHTEDVDRFYKVYEAAGGTPLAERLQQDYLDAGTVGLHQFSAMRGLTGASIARAINDQPAIYADARRCLATLPSVKARLGAALSKLRNIYPQASFPPVTILIGRGSTAGTTGASGVLIGLEKVCALGWVEANPEDRIVHMIAHEYGHVQQPAAQVDPVKPTLMFSALIEGGAEFIAKMISGGVGNPRVASWVKGRERGIETQFLADSQKTELSEWLYNGRGSDARPGDLGYWTGYRVVRAYYARAKNKPRAIWDILHIDESNATAFLKASGWRPGMSMPDETTARTGRNRQQLTHALRRSEQLHGPAT